MALFGRSRRNAKQGGAMYDPFLGDEAVRTAVTHLRNGDWLPLKDLLRRRPDRWVVETILTDDRLALPPSCLQTWAEAEGSAYATALLGQAQIRAAWAMRGRTLADDVDPNVWNSFFNGLTKAEQTLRAAAHLDPSEPAAWTGLITTARGLEMGPAAVHERFERFHAVAPFRPDGALTALQGLAQKWSGNHRAMFEFARWAHDHGPADSAACALLHIAHFEYVVVEADSGVRPTAYFSQDHVAAEIVHSAERFLAATPAEAPIAHLLPLNMFVMTVDSGTPRGAAVVREAAARIADRPTSTPWSYYGDEIAERFRSIRDLRLGVASGN